MKMSCEFHLKMLFSLLQHHFEAVLIELLTLLLAFLVVLWFLPLVVSVEDGILLC